MISCDFLLVYIRPKMLEANDLPPLQNDADEHPRYRMVFFNKLTEKVTPESTSTGVSDCHTDYYQMLVP